MSKRAGDPGYAPGWCIHYRAGQEHDDCEAGVSFSRWKDTPFDLRPCFLTATGASKPGARSCARLRRPTPDEIAAHATWRRARIDKLVKVLLVIEPWCEEQRKARRGAAQVIDCPACGAAKGLSMSIAASNGHVHARCTTVGCISFMQ